MQVIIYRQWLIFFGSGFLMYGLTGNVYWSLGVVGVIMLILALVRMNKRKPSYCLNTESLMFLFHHPYNYVEFPDAKISIERDALSRMRFIFNNSFPENQGE